MGATSKRLPNYYDLLGVDTGATPQDVKDAFRRLATRLHPDVNDNPDDHDRFRAVNEAYRILSDPAQRKKYDTMRLLGWGLPVERVMEWINDPARMQGLLHKAASVLAVASGMIRRAPGRPGRDLTVETLLDMAESMGGADRIFEYGREGDCDVCSGTGFMTVSACPTCDGKGRLVSTLVPMIAKRCPRCGAKGWVGEQRCVSCEGAGRRLRAHRVRVKVPPGVPDGYRLRVSGHGEGGTLEGADGDLIVKVGVRSEIGRRRDGNDLIAEADVPLGVAALGGPITLATPDGHLHLRIPEGSFDGRRLRVAGRGFPDPKTGRRGDAFVVLRVRAPESGNESDHELAREYLRAAGSSGAVGDDLRRRLQERFGAPA